MFCVYWAVRWCQTAQQTRGVSMLVHRLRRWSNIETALGECPVFAGKTADVSEAVGDGSDILPAASHHAAV